MPDGLVEAGSAYVYRHPKCKFFTPVRTAVGLLTVFVIWVAAVSSLVSVASLPVGAYLLFIGVPSFLLETGYIIRLCCGVNGFCCRIFGVVLYFDGVKRGLLYTVFAAFCFFPNFRNNYSIAAGAFILATALLYMLKPLQMKKASTYMVDPVQQSRSSGQNTPHVADPTVYGS